MSEKGLGLLAKWVNWELIATFLGVLAVVASGIKYGMEVPVEYGISMTLFFIFLIYRIVILVRLYG